MSLARPFKGNDILDSVGASPSPQAAIVLGSGGPEAALKHLLELGAHAHEDLQDVGGGIKVTTVKDPFGNVFGVIENPNFMRA